MSRFPAVNGQFNSQALDSGLMLAYPPATEFAGTIAGTFHDWVFTTEFDQLAEACELRYPGCRLNPASSFHVLRPNPRELDSLRVFAFDTISLAESSPELFSDGRVKRSLNAQLLDRLAQTVVSTKSQVSGSLRQASLVRHGHIVRQAEELLHHSLESDLTLTDLCTITRVSERTLRPSDFAKLLELAPTPT